VPMIDDWWLIIKTRRTSYMQDRLNYNGMQGCSDVVEKSWSRYDLSLIRKKSSLVNVPMIDDWWLIIKTRRTSYMQDRLNYNGMQWCSDVVEKSWSRYDLSVIRKNSSLVCVPMIDDWWLLMQKRTDWITTGCRDAVMWSRNHEVDTI